MSRILTRIPWIAFALAVLIAGLPHALAGLTWYPADTDDTLHYLYQTSRLISTDAFLASPSGPAASGYGSAYFVLLAILSRVTSLHPMYLYKISGIVGAFVIPACAGVFILLATGRWRTSCIGILIAGLWGGLAGYHWFATTVVSAPADTRPELLMTTDYYEPRHFGEYRGINSPLSSYLSDVPFYPKEVGFCFFWLGLGALYSQRSSMKRGLCGGALILVAILVYPYYVVPAFIVGTAFVIQTALRLRSRPIHLILLSVLVAAILSFATIGAFRAYRIYYGMSLLDAASTYRTGPAILPEQFRFRPQTILSEYSFFILVVVAGTVVRRRRTTGRDFADEESGRSALFPACVAVCIGVTTLLSVVSYQYRALTGYYGFLAPWRAVATPLILLAAARGCESLLDATGRSWKRPALRALLLLPAFSLLHWTINAAIFQKRAIVVPWKFRSNGHDLYDEFAAYGATLLGTLRVRERVIITGCPVAVGGYAQAAFGIKCIPLRTQKIKEGANPYDRLFTREARDELKKKWAAREIGDVLTLQSGELARDVLEDGTCETVARFGPYVILKPRSAADP
ncbi:MAG: hypothetical protein HYX75_01100 [Acidobacteria bacterium]|nr:hypothetical protein [Acidobacteriota bacterium]